MSKNPVMVASAAHARAVRAGDPEQIVETKRGIIAAQLQRAIDQALAAAPPLTTEQRESLAQMLLDGGAK